ncbi:hypothetical protein AGLY_015438 [Aphis glycines]|uniref:Endonuclease/exonuclease/phosphatase domain-containing protein n=1 Tax=Aphis glycines TaxID=307491 RepID=A0A6G0T0N7_APHGL|nr:hypothetical protein AGLY_015438 [Aphis glycines]
MCLLLIMILLFLPKLVTLLILLNTSLKGGGILIGVRKDLTSYPISILESNVEQLFVRISSGSLKTIVSGVYTPPSSSPFIYESHIKSVELIIRQFPNHIYIFCGYYNLPGIIWENYVNGLVYSYSTPISAHCIPETFASHSFFQSNNILNKTSSLLDLVFSNISSLVIEKSDEPIVPIDLYHPALYLSVPFNTPITYCERDHSFFNSRKTNYTNIRSFIASFDWASTIIPLGLDFAVHAFYDALHKSVIEFVPNCHFKTSSFPQWYTNGLRKTLSLKKLAHKKFTLLT